jgi:predicted PurR-regulated permease PerM
MTPSQTPVDDKIFFTRVVEATVRIGLIALLAIWCFRIMEPFVVPMIWGLIIAVAAHPGYVRLRALLGGRGVLAGVLFVLIGLVVLVVPTVVLSGTLVNGVRDLIDGFDQGTIQVPPPPAGVADWPLVGEPIHTFWSEAADNLESALLDIAPQIRAAASWVLGAAAGLGLGLLQFVFAIVIAGVLLTQDEAGQRAIFAIARRLAGERGVQFAELADATVRSVTRGWPSSSPSLLGWDFWRWGSRPPVFGPCCAFCSARSRSASSPSPSRSCSMFSPRWTR